MPKPFLPAMFLLVQLLNASAATAMSEVGALCDRAAQRAALAEGVPLDVLRAITRVETGRTRGGVFEPWPWTVNLEGKGYWFASEAEAKSYVFNVFKDGARSFDVGCFQINYRWHGKAFRSIDAMFDPDENATYAARFLNQLYVELGSWPAAAGAYHSRTQSLAQAYTDRFQTILARLEGLVPDGPDRATNTLFATAAPLIPHRDQTPPPVILGSLVPNTSTATAFIPFN